MLLFEQWVDKYSDEIDIELAENGADRELDFDRESEYESRYMKYCQEYDAWIHSEDQYMDEQELQSSKHKG